MEEIIKHYMNASLSIKLGGLASNLAELGYKQQPPEWMLSRPQITEKYGINRNALYSGMKALRDFNIINVKYSLIENKPALLTFMEQLRWMRHLR